MTSTADLIAILLVLAAVVAVANHRFVRLPRAIALMLGSMLVAAAVRLVDPYVPPDMTGTMRQLLAQAALPDVLLDFVLGLLLFAASLHVDLRELQLQRGTVAWLATAGVVISTFVFGVGIFGVGWLTGTAIPLGWCLVMGAVLAPTDAVAVDALLRRAPMPAGVRAAMAGESLFNDGAGVVLFTIMLGLAMGGHDLVGHGRIAIALAIQGLVGAALGCLTGFLVSKVLHRLDDASLRLLVSLALVAATYRIAVALHVSGPTAVVAAGLVLRATAARHPDGAARMEGLVTFWSMVDDVLNALLFVLIGFELFALDFRNLVWMPLLAAWPVSLLARAVGVAVPLAMLRGTGARQRRAVALLSWAGLRGGVSIALALSLPAGPMRNAVLVICYAVVVLSMLVQGMTMVRVIGRLYRD